MHTIFALFFFNQLVWAQQCPGCKNSIDCLSEVDCWNATDYTCLDYLCLQKDVCPGDYCQSSATCLSNGATHYCYCDEKRVGTSDLCWAALSWLPSAFVSAFLFILPLVTLPFLWYICHKTCFPSLAPLIDEKSVPETNSELPEDGKKDSDKRINVNEKTPLVTQSSHSLQITTSETTIPSGSLEKTSQERSSLSNKDDLVAPLMGSEEPEDPPFYLEAKSTPSWCLDHCRGSCVEKLARVPYKLLLAILSFGVDFFNMAATLNLILQQRQTWVNGKDYGYIVVELDGLLLFFLEVYVTWRLFHLLSPVRPHQHQWCINPGHYKFWLICYYYPNMVALAPLVGFLKIWYIVGDTAYSVYFFTSDGSLQDGSSTKILSLLVRLPYALAQSIVFCKVIFRRAKIDQKVYLTREEWYSFFAHSMKSWKENVPNVIDLLVAKYQYENKTSKDPTSITDNLKDGFQEAERIKPQYK